MNDLKLKEQFLASVAKPLPRQALTDLTARCARAGKKVSPQDRIEIAAALAHAAFLAPDRVGDTYDALTQGWLGEPVSASPIEPFEREPAQAPEGLWPAYWSIVEDARAGKLDALSITQRTAGLGGFLPAEMTARIAEMSYQYEGVAEAARRDLPPLITLETLAACPPGSLGREFHDLIVDNQFDLEVLDRDEIALSDLPAPLDYLNTRMLQAHDLWHITAGYRTTALHEIAISAFQMAQFGHNYSAQFLSVVGAVGAFGPVRGYRVLMDTIATAWVHGRETAPMILIPWEEVWDQPADRIRQTYGITPYNSPHRADLIEHSQAMAAKIQAVAGLFRPLIRLAESVVRKTGRSSG